MEVTVKTVSNQSYKVTVAETGTLNDLKAELLKLGYTESVKMVCNGKVLKADDTPLASLPDIKRGIIVVGNMAQPASSDKKPANDPPTSTPTPTPTPITTPTTPDPAPSAPAAPPAPASAPAEGDNTPVDPTMVETIMTLGNWPRDQVERALRLTRGQPDAAVALLSGDFDEGMETSEMSPLAQALSAIPFHVIRQLVMQNPSALPQVLNGLRESNPELHALIAQNQAEFLELLQNGIPGGASMPNPRGQTISITVQELPIVRRLAQQHSVNEGLAALAFVRSNRDEQAASDWLQQRGSGEVTEDEMREAVAMGGDGPAEGEGEGEEGGAELPPIDVPEEVVNEIMAIGGWTKQQVEAALRAAGGNADIATSILFGEMD